MANTYITRVTIQHIDDPKDIVDYIADNEKVMLVELKKEDTYQIK